MPNTVGSVLQIPKELLNQIQEVDKKIENLGKRSEATEKIISASFKMMAGDVRPFIDALKEANGAFNSIDAGAAGKIASALKTAATNTTDVSKGAKEIKKDFDAVAGSITQAAVNINRMSKAEEREIRAREKAEAYSRRASITNTFESYFTSYDGAMATSKQARTLVEMRNAIKDLKIARDNLNLSEKDGQKQLAILNSEIRQHSRNIQNATSGAKTLNSSYGNMFNITQQLTRQFALMFSVSQVEGYISRIASVRGEFELQQRSLQAILQNKTQADQIFSQTVALAAKSPFRIKDLVSYTKQLAAYRIENSKLYDTTKRLADVSAGLGVDMQRLILAYGQVKAAAYLRGTEVRQFTEAGINLYGELQRYFEEVKGEAYTTAQIVDMISKRKVTFEDIEAIFKRLTDEGGLFFNMQEIQAETLQGKISNLKDSLDVMLNSIGKSTEGLFKGGIDLLTTLLDNWPKVLDVAKALAALLVTIHLRNKMAGRSFMELSVIGGTTMKTLAADTTLFLGRTKLLQNMLLRIPKTMAVIGLAGKALTSVFATLVGSIKGLAIFAAIDMAVKAFLKVQEAKRLLAESTNNYYSARIRFDKIDKESKTNIKKALKELVAEMNQEGFNIVIRTNIDEKQAQSAFETYSNMYSSFLEHVRGVEARYAAQKGNWFSELYSDDIDEDLNDYAEDLGAFLNKADEMSSVFKRLSMESTTLKNEQRDLLAQFAEGPKKGEDVEAFYWKIAQALRGITEENKEFGKAFSWGGSVTDNKDVQDFLETYQTLKGSIKEAKEEAEKLFGAPSKYAKNKDFIRALIDKEAAKLQWDDVKKHIIYSLYGLTPKFSEEGTKKEVDWLEKYIQSQLDRNEFKVKLGLDDINFKGLTEYFDTLQKEYSAIRELEKGWLGSEGSKNITAGFVRGLSEGFDDWYTKVWRPGSKKLGNYVSLTWDEKNGIKTIEAYIKYAKAQVESQMKKNGLTPNEDKKDAEKRERDIWQTRIDVLKQMHSQYENVRKYLSEEAAREIVRDNFSQAMADAQLSENIVNSYVPDKQGLITALGELKKQMTDAKKRYNLEQMIATLQIEVNQEQLKGELDKAKTDVDRFFNELQLHEKLSELGLNDGEIRHLFGGIASSLDEVEKKLQSTFSGKTGSDWEKAQAEATEKLNKQRYEQSVKDFEDLTKAYRDQLDERLKIDLWYVRERRKIEENEQLKKDPVLQQQYLSNLEKMRNERTSAAEWEKFQNSDLYVRMFSNLEHVSSAALDRIREKLEGMRDSLNGLDPKQLKAINEQIEKLDDEERRRNPFKELIPNIKTYVEWLKKRKEWEEALLRLQKEQDLNDAALYDTGRQRENAKERRDNAVPGSQEWLDAQSLYKLLDDTYGKLEEKAEKIKKDTKDTTDKLDEGQKAADGLASAFSGAASFLNELSSTITDVAGSLENVFGTMSDETRDTVESISEISSGLGGMMEGLSRIADGDEFGGTLALIGGIAKTIGSIFAIGDKSKERQIKSMQERVDELSRAYEGLKEAMDEAWNMAELEKYSKASQQNLKTQASMYESMAKAEEDKKKSDKEKVKEYRETAEDLRKQAKEAEESFLEALGGFGDEANYKSAAQSFADAWVEAYSTGSDSLEALNEEFDNLMKNLVKKQAMQRFASAFLGPIFDQIDKALLDENGNVRDSSTMAALLGEAAEAAGPAMEGLNEAFKQFVELLKQEGIDITEGTSNLSALQQGIQGVTERTAEALESILNSMSYLLTRQSSDVSAIRAQLEQLIGSDSYSGNSPILSELKTQTALIRSINGLLSDVTLQGHRKGGRGIKVYMD